MKHTARTTKSAAEVIGALDRMPKERGSDFYAGRMAAGASIVWYGMKFWDARYLRSQLSEHLGGITWELEK